MKNISPNLFLSVQELIEKAKRSIVRNVNHTMVLTYFEMGRMIVEDEEEGKAYANYGSETIKRLSSYLGDHFGKGYSVDNLQLMRLFYLTYGITRRCLVILRIWLQIPRQYLGIPYLS